MELALISKIYLTFLKSEHRDLATLRKMTEGERTFQNPMLLSSEPAKSFRYRVSFALIGL